MDKNMQAEIDISAILNTYVYMDEQSSFYDGKSLGFILDHMPDDVKSTKEWQVVHDAVSQNPKLQSMTLVDQSGPSGYSDKLIIACAFQDADGNMYVAYRGTGDGKWVDNGVGIANESSIMQREANAYFDHVVESQHLDTNRPGRLIVTGHSKGGNEAQYVTLNSEYGYLIDNCYSIDGQGFSQDAIDHFKSRYGKEYYNDQLSKMYSINGENDYVHDLGNVVIPEDHTYFIKTPDANDIGGFHDITYMITGDRLNWSVDENGEIIYGEQGPIGALAKELSKHMKALNQEDLEDCAITIMSLLECFMSYDGEVGGQYRIGTGDRPFMTAEEFIGFLAHGIPMIIDTLLTTEEGRDLLMGLLKSGLESIYDKYGVFGVIGVGILTIALFPFVAKFAFFVWLDAWICDFITDLLDKLEEVRKEIKQWFSDLKETLIKWGKALKKYINSFSAGYRYATAHPQVLVDTYMLRTYADRIDAVHRRIKNLDTRLDSLYWKVGLLDLWNLMQADLLTGYSWRLARCSSYLRDTASDFESAENALTKAL